MGFAPCETGDAAREASEALRGACLLYLPDENVLLQLTLDRPLPALFRHYILTDEALTATFVQPQKNGVGPFWRSLK
jgi:hypothetical protein